MYVYGYVIAVVWYVYVVVASSTVMVVIGSVSIVDRCCACCVQCVCVCCLLWFNAVLVLSSCVTGYLCVLHWGSLFIERYWFGCLSYCICDLMCLCFVWRSLLLGLMLRYVLMCYYCRGLFLRLYERLD